MVWLSGYSGSSSLLLYLQYRVECLIGVRTVVLHWASVACSHWVLCLESRYGVFVEITTRRPHINTTFGSSKFFLLVAVSRNQGWNAWTDYRKTTLTLRQVDSSFSEVEKIFHIRHYIEFCKWKTEITANQTPKNKFVFETCYQLKC